ncbi:metal ABC transporter substrate-binding protein [Atrimonas thermophila]|jgi:zinc transport system substrate-binding protein|uniref:metal ABC transporter substrate-binding protein n=1 Tax=Atrimonas thermophila TaxID=3064161 RepID=UPI00399C99F4
MKKHFSWMLFTSLIWAMILCFPHPALPKENTLSVATSIAPLASLIKEIADNEAEVICIIPPGSEPHTFELKPKDMVRLEKAKLLFAVGWNFENFIKQLLIHLSEKVDIVEVNKGIEPIYYASKEPNPHIWLSANNIITITHTIAEYLSQIDPSNREYYFKNAQSLITKIQELHHRFSQKFRSLKNRSFIASHPSWSYLARDYDLQEIGVLEEGPHQIPSPRAIKDLIQKAREKGTKLVLADRLHNPQLAEMIAREIGGKVLYLDVLGSPDTSCWELLERNLEPIYQALSEHEQPDNSN